MQDWWLPLITEVERRLGVRGFGWKSVLFEKANANQIAIWEDALGTPLPPSYRDFLLRANGAEFDIKEPLKGHVFEAFLILLSGSDCVSFKNGC